MSHLHFKEGVNLLVGPNGSGKTTIFNILTGKLQEDRSEMKITGSNKYVSFSSEVQASRNKGSFSQDATKFHVELSGHFKSRGQYTMDYVRVLKYYDPEEDGMILMDEPEQALDKDNQLKLVSLLKEKPITQAIIATHSPFLIFSGFHIIELNEGYVENLRQELRKLVV